MPTDSNRREDVIRRCEAILQGAGMASIIVAADLNGHSYGLQVPAGSCITMSGENDVIVPRDASEQDLVAEVSRFAGLYEGGALLLKSVRELLRITSNHVNQARGRTS